MTEVQQDYKQECLHEYLLQRLPRSNPVCLYARRVASPSTGNHEGWLARLQVRHLANRQAFPVKSCWPELPKLCIGETPVNFLNRAIGHGCPTIYASMAAASGQGFGQPEEGAASGPMRAARAIKQPAPMKGRGRPMDNSSPCERPTYRVFAPGGRRGR